MNAQENIAGLGAADWLWLMAQFLLTLVVAVNGTAALVSNSSRIQHDTMGKRVS